jgi:membrane protease YdiL (CAAX protease family)
MIRLHALANPTAAPTLWSIARSPARSTVRFALCCGLAWALLTALLLTANRPAVWGWILSTLWLAPLCEELFFRTCLHEALLVRVQRRLAPQTFDATVLTRRDRLLANVAVALLFAATHAVVRGPWTGAAVLLPALAMGRAYEATRRWEVAAAVHALLNLPWLLWQLERPS